MTAPHLIVSTPIMDEQEYDLTVPANGRYSIRVIKAVTLKAGTLTYHVVQLSGAAQKNHRGKKQEDGFV